jgi:hypothetical protein
MGDEAPPTSPGGRAARLLGDPDLSSARDVETIIAKDEAGRLGYVDKSQRHILQVDFGLYVHDLLKEIGRGEKRARHAQPAL